MAKNIYTEKYRPIDLDTMNMNKINKDILINIIERNEFPNLLFYGPPGTGKTTTVINLIDKFLQKNNIKNKGLVMHFNASDDRGIDLIRKNIVDFIQSKGLLSNNLKFVILDEVDYMTKQAQTQLKLEIEKYYDKVRFCLICNYISKIERSLLSEFIIMRFSNLSKKKKEDILTNIVKNENLNKSNEEINDILNYFKTDIRSMINFLQHNNQCIFNYKEYTDFLYCIKTMTVAQLKDTLYEKCIYFNISINNYIKNVLEFIIEKNDALTSDQIITLERLFIYHFDIDYFLSYLKANNTSLFVLEE